MLNDKNKNEELLKLYSKAPTDIQKMILDKNFGPVIYVIGKDHGLTALQSLDVEDAVADVLLGVTKQKDLAQNIAVALNTTEEISRKIVTDIDKNIFSEVRASLSNISRQNENKVVINSISETKKTVPQIEIDKKKLAIEELTKPILPPVPKPIQQNTTAETFQKTETIPNAPQVKTEIGKTSITNTPKIENVVGEEKNKTESNDTEHMFERKLRDTLNTTNSIGDTEQNTPPIPKIDPYREQIK